jgi:hypothetical protein
MPTPSQQYDDVYIPQHRFVDECVGMIHDDEYQLI